MKKQVIQRSILLAAAILLLAACDKKKEKEDFSDVQGNYFSINQYILDQWNTFAGEPFVIQKTMWVNGRTMDSSYSNSDTINWSRLFDIFSKTDISDRKFLGNTPSTSLTTTRMAPTISFTWPKMPTSSHRNCCSL